MSIHRQQILLRCFLICYVFLSFSLKANEQDENDNKEDVVWQINLQGDTNCPCIAETQTTLMDMSNCQTASGERGVYNEAAGGGGACFPIYYGGTGCDRHDYYHDPRCQQPKAKQQSSSAYDGNNIMQQELLPAYCYEYFCFVNSTKCKQSTHLYFASQVWPDKELYYSYTTCNSTSEAFDAYTTTQVFANKEHLSIVLPEIRYASHYKVEPNQEKSQRIQQQAYWQEQVYWNETLPWQGWMIDYMHAVAEHANLPPLQFITRSVGSDLTSPSKPDAALHDVTAGLADVALDMYWFTSQRLREVPFTVPVTTDRIVLWIQQPPQANTLSTNLRANAQKLVEPFTATLWLTILATIFVVAFLNVVFAQESGYGSRWFMSLRDDAFVQAPWYLKVLRIVKVVMDSFRDSWLSLFGGSVEVTERASVPQKFLLSGFGFLAFIIATAYTANLAAFLTLSADVDYLSSMEMAVATGTPLCAHPSLVDELQDVWPEAVFVVNNKDYAPLSGILKDFDAGRCKAIVTGFVDLRSDPYTMQEFCQRQLVSTGSVAMQKNVGFPVQRPLEAGLSYWLMDAHQNGITFDKYLHSTDSVCNLKLVVNANNSDALVPLSVSNMLVPLFLLASCMIVALLAHFVPAFHESQEQVWRRRMRENRQKRAALMELANQQISAAWPPREDGDDKDDPRVSAVHFEPNVQDGHKKRKKKAHRRHRNAEDIYLEGEEDRGALLDQLGDVLELLKEEEEKAMR